MANCRKDLAESVVSGEKLRIVEISLQNDLTQDIS